ncbi:MAG: PAS domain S-box protein [Cyanobacteria bacterium SZAS LIN-5]|nr:PAS domain S-box protein [Cyanobacteria bacterium SZAS LIN-5]
MNLLQRGILVTTFPLICQILFVGWLSFLLWQVQTSLIRISHAHQITKETHELVANLTQENVMNLLSLEPQPIAATMDKFNKSIDHLASETKDDLALQEQLNKVRAASDNNFRVILLRARHGPQWHQLEIDRQLMKYSSIFYSASSALIDQVEMKYGAHPVDIDNLKMYIASAIAFAVPSSLIISLLLARSYARGIRNPLTHICANSQLMSNELPLLEPLKSHDEIGRLDRLIHQVARSLEETLARERDLISNAAELICVIDVNGFFVSANPYAERLLGVESEQIIGKHLVDVVAQHDRSTADDQIGKTHADQGSSVFDLQLMRADGELIDTTWSIFWSAMRQSFFCVVQDVTEQKKVDRMRQDFVDMISHDLRSPLCAINVSLEVAYEHAKRLGLDDTLSELKSSIKNTELLINFVNSLLDFQKLKSGKMEIQRVRCDIVQLISQASDLVLSSAEAKGINVEIPSNQCFVECDPQKIIQTVMNLLSNAIKFSNKNTSVCVSIEHLANFTKVLVSDNGPGIPEENRENIFDAFYQIGAANSKEGTGLGLAICKLIIETHGGTIGVTGNHPDGSIFWFTLPNSQ